MKTIIYKNKTFELDDLGYLSKPWEWSKEISEYIAKHENIELSEEHWRVIEEARQYYNKYGSDEMPIMACKHAGLDKNCIPRLFDGSIRTFEKIAGLEMTWATS
ncbi:DsrC-like protein [Candidatus Magnetoovum chiemensis]|nr:DsrC-like protein [Candidatus Magnetoovum chiemensis]